MSKFLSNFIGGIKILVNPRYLKGKINEINQQIDNVSAMNIVAKAQLKELVEFAAKYPTDSHLHEKIHFIETLPNEDKDDIVDLVNMKKEIMSTEEKQCSECSSLYIYGCSHK